MASAVGYAGGEDDTLYAELASFPFGFDKGEGGLNVVDHAMDDLGEFMTGWLAEELPPCVH